MSEPSPRRLGVGGGGGGDRPIRAQLVVAVMVGLILIAVPLYLWRRPSGVENAPDAGAAATTASAAAGAGGSPLLEAADARPKKERVKLGKPVRVKCSASPGSRGQEGNLCDRLPIFEEALAKAIRENVDCAPKTGKEGTINYVLSIDFRRHRVRVYPGKSGQWKGPQAKRAARCVHRSLPAPQWDAIRHQYKYYLIAVMATYPSPAAFLDPNAPPLFE